MKGKDGEGRTEVAGGTPSASAAFRLAHLPITLARGLFLGLLVYAPWAYGCTRAWAVEGLEIGLTCVLGLWLVGSAWRRRRPAVPGALWWVSVLLLAQGWWMAANAHFVRDGDYLVFLPLRTELLPGAPGSIEGALSREWMGRGMLLLGSAAFVAAAIAPRPISVARARTPASSTSVR